MDDLLPLYHELLSCARKQMEHLRDGDLDGALLRMTEREDIIGRMRTAAVLVEKSAATRENSAHLVKIAEEILSIDTEMGKIVQQGMRTIMDELLTVQETKQNLATGKVYRDSGTEIHVSV
jgi:Trp operon repressor